MYLHRNGKSINVHCLLVKVNYFLLDKLDDKVVYISSLAVTFVFHFLHMILKLCEVTFPACDVLTCNDQLYLH